MLMSDRAPFRRWQKALPGRTGSDHVGRRGTITNNIQVRVRVRVRVKVRVRVRDRGRRGAITNKKKPPVCADPFVLQQG
jgi:hypothetical protein